MAVEAETTAEDTGMKTKAMATAEATAGEVGTEIGDKRLREERKIKECGIMGEAEEAYLNSR